VVYSGELLDTVSMFVGLIRATLPVDDNTDVVVVGSDRDWMGVGC
jgi:hypothetical protein